MASNNRSLVEDVYGALGRGDLDFLLTNSSDDIEWHVANALPFGGTFHGRDEMLATLTSVPSHWEQLEVIPENYVSEGDEVVVLGTYHLRGNGGASDVEFAHRWTLRDGKAVRFHEVIDTARALEALGTP